MTVQLKQMQPFVIAFFAASLGWYSSKKRHLGHEQKGRKVGRLLYRHTRGRLQKVWLRQSPNRKNGRTVDGRIL